MHWNITFPLLQLLAVCKLADIISVFVVVRHATYRATRAELRGIKASHHSQQHAHSPGGWTCQRFLMSEDPNCGVVWSIYRRMPVIIGPVQLCRLGRVRPAKCNPIHLTNLDHQVTILIFPRIHNNTTPDFQVRYVGPH
jgi:hypothetical protein